MIVTWTVGEGGQTPLDFCGVRIGQGILRPNTTMPNGAIHLL